MLRRGIVRAVRGLTTEELKLTALFDFHVANGGKMVPFAGWSMPVLYSNMGIKESHMWTREHAGLFDVSHMGQLRITGEDRFAFIESVSPGNIADLRMGGARLTQLTNERGGIMDDTMITKKDGYVYQVVNAGCAEADMEHLDAQLELFDGDCEIEYLNPKRSLLAIQGPSAVEVVQDLVDYDLADQAFMTNRTETVAGVENCFVARCGYTGEDGFEISVPNEGAVQLAEALTSHPETECIGLGARDTLRLECGLCLMGSDMNADMTVIEADLAWTLGKRRKDERNFPGADIIMSQLEEGSATKKRVGFVMNGRRVAREHYAVLTLDGEDVIGEVTSGTLSPVLDIPVGMMFVDIEHSDIGTEVLVDIRGKQFPATISAMPFVPTSYYRKPKQ